MNYSRIFIYNLAVHCYWVCDEKWLVRLGTPGPGSTRICFPPTPTPGKVGSTVGNKALLTLDYSQDKALSGSADIVSNVTGLK